MSIDLRNFSRHLSMPHDPVACLAKQITDQIRNDAKSGVLKTNVDDLTPGEKFALAYYAGVPVRRGDIREPKIWCTFTTLPCSMFHDGEKWRVYMRAEDER